MDYQKQAIDFLKKANASIEIKFLHTGKHFAEDKEDRDIYDITISKANRKMTLKFGNSIANSGQYIMHFGDYAKITLSEDFDQAPRPKMVKELSRITGQSMLFGGDRYRKNKDFKRPTEYDILACLTKYDPETLENFCANYGYDEDSKTAEKVYNACTKEYKDLLTIFTDEEMTELQEIN